MIDQDAVLGRDQVHERLADDALGPHAQDGLGGAHGEGHLPAGIQLEKDVRPAEGEGYETIARERPAIRMIAADISDAAVEVARRNAARFDLFGGASASLGALAAVPTPVVSPGG